MRLLIAIAKPPKRLQHEFDQALEMLVGYLNVHDVQDMTIVKTFELDEMPMVYRGSELFVLVSENTGLLARYLLRLWLVVYP